MDPNLFHLDYERLLEVITTIAFLAIILERALSLLFESRPFLVRTESGKVIVNLLGLTPGDKDYAKYINRRKTGGLKELISFIAAVILCWALHFDALTISLAAADNTTFAGYLVTGAVVAGGSKGSVQLFQGFMKVMSNTMKAKKELGIK